MSRSAMDRVPENVRDGRFGGWLRNARDWNVSRNRYWGTPIPLWTSSDYEEVRRNSVQVNMAMSTS